MSKFGFLKKKGRGGEVFSLFRNYVSPQEHLLLAISFFYVIFVRKLNLVMFENFSLYYLKMSISRRVLKIYFNPAVISHVTVSEKNINLK